MSDAIEALLAIVGVGVVAAYCGTMALVDVRTGASCLAYGYPDHQVTWTFTRYCHRRENTNDVVILLSTLQAGGRR